jgi:septum formation protein
MGGLLVGLILASGSPQRRKLLRRLRRPFRIIPSDVSERSSQKDPRKLVILLARRKALAVARRHRQDIVIGADTLVVCQGRIIGKPRDRADSARILRLLNGRWQRVYTGVAVAADGGKRLALGAVISRVKARKLDAARLESLTGKHMDKAGAYAVQDKDDPLVERIVGPLDNVIGLPVEAVRRLLARIEKAP